MGFTGNSMYSVGFDAASMQRFAALLNAQPTFARYNLAAMRYCVNLVNKRAQANAPVLRGTLRRGIRGYVLSPWLGQVGVLAAVPYGRRREFGFDNMTDALGRTYSQGDPLYTNTESRSHMMYLHRALEDSLPEIGAAFRTATQLAIRSYITP
jgi:hypothetical protein